MSACTIPSCRGNRRKEGSGELPSSSRQARPKQTSKDSQAGSARSGSQADSGRHGSQADTDRHGSQADSAQRDSQAGRGGSQSDSIQHVSRSTPRGSQDAATGGTVARSGSSGTSGEEHTRNNNIPPQTTFSDTLILVRRNVKNTVNNAYAFWKKVREDRFRWQLFKSVLFFTLGLKLFDDLKRHMAHIAKGPAKGAGVRALGRGAKAAANCKRSLS